MHGSKETAYDSCMNTVVELDPREHFPLVNEQEEWSAVHYGCDCNAYDDAFENTLLSTCMEVSLARAELQSWCWLLQQPCSSGTRVHGCDLRFVFRCVAKRQSL